MEYLVELQSEEEKWGIVGDGRHIVRIALRKLLGIVRLDQLGERFGAGGILRLHIAGGQSRIGWSVQQK